MTAFHAAAAADRIAEQRMAEARRLLTVADASPRVRTDLWPRPADRRDKTHAGRRVACQEEVKIAVDQRGRGFSPVFFRGA